MAAATQLLTVALVIPPLTGVALGQGKSSAGFLQALNFQPRAQGPLQRIFFLGLALLETAAILSIVIGVLLWGTDATEYMTLGAYTGIVLAMAIPGFLVSFRSAYPLREAFNAVARQPQMGQAITNMLLLMLSFIQTPLIFCFIMSWFLIAHGPPAHLADALRLFATGGTLALGIIGPTLGMTQFVGTVCNAIGKNRNSYNNIVSFTFISQAIIETPILFSLIVTLLLFFVVTPATGSFAAGIPYIFAMITLGSTAFGAGISSSRTASTTCQSIARYPHSHRALSRISVLAQTLIDTNVIYGLIIAFFFLFFA